MIAGLQRIAAGIVLLVAIFCFYEGVPGLKSVPFVGWAIEGRVDTVARLAAIDARKGYVLEAEKAALQARLAETQRQLREGAIVVEEYRKRQAADDVQEAKIAENHEREISEYEEKLKAAGRSRLLDESDLDFIMRD